MSHFLDDLPNEEKIGASAVIYYNKDRKTYILVGKESNYLHEKVGLTQVQINKIKEKQKFKLKSSKSKSPEKEPNLIRAKLFFQKGAEELEEELNIPEVRFDEAIYNDADQTYETIYRYLVEDSKWGIIKGKKKDQNEESKDTIHREIMEEVGLVMNKGSIHFYVNSCTYNCYRLLVSDYEKIKGFNGAILDRKNRHKGEMFDLEFKELSEINNLLNTRSFNNTSACAIKSFLSLILTKGGKTNRRTQKRGRRGSRRRK
jgi:hypothetical protein